MDLNRVFKRCDLAQWPLAPDNVAQLVRVRLVQGPEEILNKFQELHVRASVARQLARLFIDSHVRDLADRPGVLCIHAEQGADTVQHSLHAHAIARLERYYPETEYPAEGGGIIPEIRAMVEEQATRNAN